MKTKKIFAKKTKKPGNSTHGTSVQRKVKVGEPGSKSEKEADNVADRVMRMPEPGKENVVSMQPQEENEEQAAALQMQPEEESTEGAVQMQPEEEESKEAVQMQPEEEGEKVNLEEDDEVQAKEKDELQKQEEEEPGEGAVQMQEDEEISEKKIQKQENEEELRAKLQKQESDDETLETKIQRKPEEEEISTKANNPQTAKSSYAPVNVVKQLNASKSGGNSLPQNVNRELSTKMGSDFSNVKIHTDSRAVGMNKKLSAKAFTHKNHIYFNERQYSPASREGKKLLAHELTHVIQQTGKADTAIQREWVKDKYRYSTEKEAARRRLALKKKYGKADCYPVGKQWQCRYWVGGQKSAKGAKPEEKQVKPAKPTWITDKGKYYKDRAGAVSRAKALSKSYGKVEVFKRKDNNWQCRYMKVAPLEEARAAKASVSLIKIKSDINNFKVTGLNDALLTVFGEISGNIHPQLEAEAKAVTSTIFNRYVAIIKSRGEYKKLLAKKKTVSSAYEVAKAKLEDLTKNPSKYKKSMGNDKYEKAVEAARKAYKAALSSQSRASKALIKANSEKIAAESYMKAEHRGKSKITLTMIVDDKGQYEGYPKGKSDFGKYAKMSEPDKIRNSKRWETAKKSVKSIASNTKLADTYTQFRSNYGGKRKMNKGDVRIGGNDFWE